jgi:hypothetical protein
MSRPVRHDTVYVRMIYLRRMPPVFVFLLAACGAGAYRDATLVQLVPACGPTQLRVAGACTDNTVASARIEAGKQAIADVEYEAADKELDAAMQSGPLNHQSNIELWEQRGIVAANLEKPQAAAAAFDMLLALNPRHLLSYTLAPKVTFSFEKVRTATHVPPALDVTWPRDLKVGGSVPINIEVVADPKSFLSSATVFVRERGTKNWMSADVVLPAGSVGKAMRVYLPGLSGTRTTAMELYVEGRDARGNAVLQWADSTRPRDIALRYEAPTPWFKKWWVIAAAGSVVAVGTGAIVYATTLAPPSRITGTVVGN